MGTRQYLLRLKTISDIAQYDSRALYDGLKYYNTLVTEDSKVPLSTSTEDMLSLSDFQLREVLKYVRMADKKRGQ